MQEKGNSNHGQMLKIQNWGSSMKYVWGNGMK